ncbi:MAG: hypothetical protein ACI3YC_05210, partial [Alloprevotella sp.]
AKGLQKGCKRVAKGLQNGRSRAVQWVFKGGCHRMLWPVVSAERMKAFFGAVSEKLGGSLREKGKKFGTVKAFALSSQ